ncbi:MAG TPA: isoprenylcysteine carboxylmethyltransferase family protein [Bacteroidota bacterium]|nr:isoprenylcysteine carboxylmethyltransferase family protein [Bacteroidota bacterium]
MKAASDVAWWKGQQGEWYVVVQVALFMLIIFGPPTLPGFSEWPPAMAPFASYLGMVLIVGGIMFIGAGLWELRSQLTPLPYPKEGSVLITCRAYAIVRHPIYTGGIFMAFGWALFIHGWLTLGYAVLLLVFLDIKSRREEVWLLQKFPAYAAYRKRVRRLIPFLY